MEICCGNRWLIVLSNAEYGKKDKQDVKVIEEQAVTKGGAEMAVFLLLEVRPDLVLSLDNIFLNSREYSVSSYSSSSA